jgi:hypothetical protein
LRLRRWDPKKRQLSLHVCNTDGKEVGVVRFAPVSFVCLPVETEVETLETCAPDSLPTDFWSRGSPTAASLRSAKAVVFVHTPDRQRHYLVTSGVRYDRT